MIQERQKRILKGTLHMNRNESNTGAKNLLMPGIRIKTASQRKSAAESDASYDRIISYGASRSELQELYKRYVPQPVKHGH